MARWSARSARKTVARGSWCVPRDTRQRRTIVAQGHRYIGDISYFSAYIAYIQKNILLGRVSPNPGSLLHGRTRPASENRDRSPDPALAGQLAFVGNLGRADSRGVR